MGGHRASARCVRADSASGAKIAIFDACHSWRKVSNR